MRTASLIALLLGFTSCGAFRFDVAQALPMQEVPGASWAHFLTDLLPAPFRLTIDVQSETEQQGTGPATGAALKALTLQARDDGATFDFLDSITLFVESDGLARQALGAVTPVPRGATTLGFTTDPAVDLLPYLNRGATLTSTVSGSAPPQTFHFDGEVIVELRI